MEQISQVEVAESFEAYWQELIGQKPAQAVNVAESKIIDLPIGCFSQNDT